MFAPNMLLCHGITYYNYAVYHVTNYRPHLCLVGCPICHPSAKTFPILTFSVGSFALCINDSFPAPIVV